MTIVMHFIRHRSGSCNGSPDDSDKKRIERSSQTISARLSLFRTRSVHAYQRLCRRGSESTSSQLGPAAMSTFRGTFKSSAVVMARRTSSASLGISAAGASKTSSSWIWSSIRASKFPDRRAFDRAGSWPA